MEGWQREHIKKNLVELIKLTTCNVNLIARLAAKNVLGKDDEEELELPNMTSSKKSKRLYEILVTRVGAYDDLLKSLEETKQSGAVEVLKAHSVLFRSFGSIAYDENHVLGTGSSGTKVFKGVFGKRDVAVKVLPTYLISPAVAAREVNMLTKLDNHPNIIRYFTAESRDHFICIALELCVISLQDEVKMNLVNMDKVEVLRQCTEGLAHLHENNVIHGDLKPANILLSEHQQVKLSDFGTAKQIQTGATSAITANVGTLDYLAPEILKPVLDAEGMSVTVKMSHSADVFSLGCVFHFALTSGVHPFGTSPFQRQTRILQCNSNVSGDIEDQWKNVILKMISSTPTDRPSVEIILSTFLNTLNAVPKSEAKVCLKPKETTSIAHQNPPHVDKTTNSVSKSTPSIFEQIRKMFENTQLTKKAAMTQKPTMSHGHVFPAAAALQGQHPPIENKTNSLTTNSPLNLEVKLAQEMSETTQSIRPKTTPSQAGPSVVPAKHQNCIESETGLSDNVKLSEQELAALNAVDEDGNNALFRAVKSGESLTRIRHLVENGVEWKGKNKANQTVLHCAVLGGNLDAVKYFISLGAGVHARTKSGGTALLFAAFAKKNCKEIVSVLVKAGCDVNSVDKDGDNLVLLAACFGRSRDELEEIVKLGVPWQSKNKGNRTVLHMAAEGGNLDAAKYFISLSADVKAKGSIGGTPLHWVCYAEKNFEKIVTLLTANGAQINATDNKGRTLLDWIDKWAKEENKVERIAFVVEMGGVRGIS